MLSNMFIGNPPGNYDRILDFSQALTGSLFFVPTADLLDRLHPRPVPASTSKTAARKRLSRRWLARDRQPKERLQ